MAGVALAGAALLAAGLVTRLGIFFLLLYVVVGVYMAAKLWVWSAERSLKLRRELPKRVFLGERIPVTISLRNDGFLPIPWASVRESLPHELATYDVLRRVIALRPRSTQEIGYELKANRRGYHPVGPLEVRLGDVFGFAQRVVRLDVPENVIVYPEIVPLSKLGLPSTTPFGVVKTPRILYQDPARVIGVREYTPADSPRTINWKVSAAAGKLFVRQLEPAVSHEVMIFVDLNPAGYTPEWVFHASELAIVVAASLATALISERQTVGIVVNGMDRMLVGGRAVPAGRAMSLRGAHSPQVAPGKGRSHLMKILELLARVGLLAGGELSAEVKAASLRLAWGSTLVTVSGMGDPGLAGSLLGRKKAGHNVMAVFTDPAKGRLAAARASAAGMAARAVISREGLDAWRDGRTAS